MTREASLADVGRLARIRAAVWGTEQYWRDRIGGYMRGELHPQQALAPRVILVAEDEPDIAGLIAGHLTRRYGCDGELEWLDVVAERRRTGVAVSCCGRSRAGSRAVRHGAFASMLIPTTPRRERSIASTEPRI